MSSEGPRSVTAASTGEVSTQTVNAASQSTMASESDLAPVAAPSPLIGSTPPPPTITLSEEQSVQLLTRVTANSDSHSQS